MVSVEFVEKSLKTKAVRIGHPRNSYIEGFSIDSRDISINECFIAIRGENRNGHNYIHECNRKGVRFFIIQNDYKNKAKKQAYNSFIIPVKNTTESLAVLAKAYKKHIFASSIGITGSSGKTTTRELIGLLLSTKYNVYTSIKNYNNAIGLPLAILQAKPQTHIMVLEMGMNHKGEIKILSNIAQPLVGVITNVGYAHIGMLGSLENIAGAKAEIFEGINPHGMAVLNRDDDFLEYFKKVSPVDTIEFGISDLTVIEDRGLDGYRLSYRGMEFDFQLAGTHNLSNLAAALKVGEIYRIDEKAAVEALSQFKPVIGRSEIIRGNFTIIHDTYNANPSSMFSAFDLLKKSKGRKIAVLSDMLELGHMSHSLHSLVGRHLSESGAADAVFACGHDARSIIDNIKSPGIERKYFPSQQELIENLKGYIETGDTILVKASHGMKMENTVDELLKIQVPSCSL